MPTDGGTPLLDDDVELGASAPALEEMHPSAPPSAMTQGELKELIQALPPGHADLPSEQALRSFRTATAGKVVWAEQMREIASTAAGGSHFFREAYERQFILDPETLTAADGPWAELIPSAPPDTGATPGVDGAHAAQALLNQLVVIRFDGCIANISVNSAQTWLEIGHQAASRFGNVVFDPLRHELLGVGQAKEKGLQAGQTVKITAVVNRAELNGKIGRIVRVNGDELDVALPHGVERLHQDNVVPHYVSVVTRGGVASPLDFNAPAETLGVVRVLWLEKTHILDDATSPKSPAQQSRPTLQGPMKAIGGQYIGMSSRRHNLVSLGEFRNFLWNLHLDDENFAVVSKRFAPSGNYIDYEEVLFLLGRSHLRCKDVPVDALIYESVVSILGRRTTAHIDRDLGAEDLGIGKRNACKEHCASYTVSLILEAVIWLSLAVGLVAIFLDEAGHLRLEPEMLAPAGIAYLIYIIHLACCVRLTRAFSNETSGIEAVLAKMDRPRFEHPHYTWTVQCYHYRTVTRTTRDKDGRTQTHTERKRVNTHYARATGVIPSEDQTPEFIPNTRATQTQIDTTLELDLSRSNYIDSYHSFCRFHRRDVHQDCHRNEELPSRCTSCLAVWSQRNMPCWLNAGCYWAANLFAMSFLYRFLAQSRIGSQRYIYLKKCFNIRRY